MNLVDANIILRYLLDDGGEMSERSAQILENDTIYITGEVIAEVVYVLEKVYKAERKDISRSLCALVENFNINTFDSQVTAVALKTYAAQKIDIVDALLFAYSKVKKYKVFTFDKKLLKLLQTANSK
jgi:predicted nucleic-acid-binding protein